MQDIDSSFQHLKHCPTSVHIKKKQQSKGVGSAFSLAQNQGKKTTHDYSTKNRDHIIFILGVWKFDVKYSLRGEDVQRVG